MWFGVNGRDIGEMLKCRRHMTKCEQDMGKSGCHMKGQNRQAGRDVKNGKLRGTRAAERKGGSHKKT